MKHLYQPQVPMMNIQATADELIALGWVITQHLRWVECVANKSSEQLELIALLRSFQGRLIAHVQPTPLVLPAGARGRR